MTLPLAAPRLRIEHFPERVRLGISETRPRLSWIIDTAPAGYRQDAYELAWTITAPGVAEAAVPRTTIVESPDQVLVPWPGEDLPSRSRVSVTVRTRDADTASWSEWSDPAVAERGLDASDWTALLVGPGYEEPPLTERRAPLVRGEFELPAAIVEARLHLTAHGLVEVEINGQRVGRDELIPGWTPYAEYLRVFTYDVTAHLHPGNNAIGAWLGDGWFRGRIGFEGGTENIYGEHVGVLAQVEVVFADGSTHTVTSGTDWRSAPGPLTRASLYDGERIDLALIPAGWSEPGFDDSAWSPTEAHPLDYAILSSPAGEPVRAVEELLPQTISAVDGGWLIDYGQNHSGRPRLRIPAAPAGTHITVQHAEVLQDGRLCRRPLREAASVDEVITAGEAVEWEPRFTIHGYRYAFVTGWPGEEPPSAGSIVSRVLHSDMQRTGWFRSDREDLNRLHENVVWGLRSNFVDIPTDCPQRDERLGWTGDIQLFAPTASFLYDVHGVLDDWLRSLRVEQDRYGGNVPVYVPWVPGGAWWRPDGEVAGWGDAAAIVPEALYGAFGDAELVARQYASARTWVEKVSALAGPSRLWDQQRQLGDWLDPAAPPDRPFEAVTDPHLVSTAYFARSTAALAELAKTIGETDDAERYRSLAAEIRAAYRRRYVESGDASHDTVAAHALTIAFDLIDDADGLERAGTRLDALIRERGYRVSTGFLGTPVVTEALTRTGHLDTAYRMVLNHDAPSWMATIDLGATTVWERWDSLLPDGSVNPGDMTSFNHYALGSVAHWIHGTIAGLSVSAPGGRELRIAPRPGPGVSSAGATLTTPYGEAAVDWELVGDQLTLSYTVPVGASAVVELPGREAVRVGHGSFAAQLSI
ncbi:family 78 glycoside hydrolase catalytic domain [Microbacterium sp.]|uniref:alpha-L-rhamnosidase n=1 Tax=Microbacterium sp. TaxID=51671 RepID=UPI003C71EABB